MPKEPKKVICDPVNGVEENEEMKNAKEKIYPKVTEIKESKIANQS